MTEPQTFNWPLSQERIELLANELYALQDTANRLVPGCRRGETVFCLLNDLRAHAVAAGAADPFPWHDYGIAFADTPVPAWPDARYLNFEEEMGEGEA